MKDTNKKNLPEIKKKSVWIISFAAVILTITVIVFAFYLRNGILAKKLEETRCAYEESLRSVDELNNSTEYLENVFAVPAFTSDDDGSDLYDVVKIRVHFNEDFSGLPAKEQYLAIREANKMILDFTSRKKKECGYAGVVDDKDGNPKTLRLRGKNIKASERLNFEYTSPGYSYDYSEMSFKVSSASNEE